MQIVYGDVIYHASVAGDSNAGKYLEFSIEEADYYPWQFGLFVSRYAIDDGHAMVTDRPGWGVEIHPDWLTAAQYKKTAIADLPQF